MICGLVRRWNLTSQRSVDEVENGHLEIETEQVRARLCRNVECCHGIFLVHKSHQSLNLQHQIDCHPGD